MKMLASVASVLVATLFGVVPASAATPNRLAGYEIVASAQQVLRAHTEQGSNVQCTGNKVPLSGGVTISSSSISTVVKSSFPSARGWSVDLVNDTDLDTNFVQYVICARQPKGYTLSSFPEFMGPNDQLHFIDRCAANKQVTGGGMAMEIGAPGQTLNSSAPAHGMWTLAVNNRSSMNVQPTEFIICVSPLAGYQIVRSGVFDNPVGAQSPGTVSCPVHKLAVGGGPISGAGQDQVSINSTYPVGRAWDAYENNGSPADNSLAVTVACVSG
jgi:hypothetical protein